jgi:hypothetical protein
MTGVPAPPRNLIISQSYAILQVLRKRIADGNFPDNSAKIVHAFLRLGRVPAW